MLVGLGNPGAQYDASRHNVGFMVTDTLCGAGVGMDWRNAPRLQGELAKGRLDDQEVVLLKPQTYMNLSGESVGAAARFYRISTERVVVIHDDVDLELGRLKIKAGGGDGGHKGIRSIAQHLGGPGFFRIRLGIGRPEHGEVADFVLQRFRPAERIEVEQQIERASQAVRVLMERGLRATMNRFNGLKKEENGQEAKHEKKQDSDSGIKKDSF